MVRNPKGQPTTITPARAAYEEARRVADTQLEQAIRDAREEYWQAVQYPAPVKEAAEKRAAELRDLAYEEARAAYVAATTPMTSEEE